jgi:hypothetical protein cdivTM_09431
MIHKLYSAYDLPADHDTCHLFEHLIIRRFLKETEKVGGNRAFTGELDGTTSESSVFFTSALFTSESNTLFEKIINDIAPFEMPLIQQSISHIEAEMQSNIDIADMTLLQEQLALCQKYFIDSQKTTPSNSHPKSKIFPLKISHSPKDFTDVKIADASDELTAAFFCTYPILLELVRGICFDKISSYPSSPGKFIAYYDGNYTSQTYTVKNTDLARLSSSETIQTYLQNFDISSHATDLRNLAEAFTSDPFYISVPIYFYQQTATPLSRNDLAKTINVANMNTILKQVKATIILDY